MSKITGILYRSPTPIDFTDAANRSKYIRLIFKNSDIQSLITRDPQNLTLSIAPFDNIHIDIPEGLSEYILEDDIINGILDFTKQLEVYDILAPYVLTQNTLGGVLHQLFNSGLSKIEEKQLVTFITHAPEILENIKRYLTSNIDLDFEKISLLGFLDISLPEYVDFLDDDNQTFLSSLGIKLPSGAAAVAAPIVHTTHRDDEIASIQLAILEKIVSKIMLKCTGFNIDRENFIDLMIHSLEGIQPFDAGIRVFPGFIYPSNFGNMTWDIIVQHCLTNFETYIGILNKFYEESSTSSLSIADIKESKINTSVLSRIFEQTQSTAKEVASAVALEPALSYPSSAVASFAPAAAAAAAKATAIPAAAKATAIPATATASSVKELPSPAAAPAALAVAAAKAPSVSYQSGVPAAKAPSASYQPAVAATAAAEAAKKAALQRAAPTKIKTSKLKDKLKLLLYIPTEEKFTSVFLDQLTVNFEPSSHNGSWTLNPIPGNSSKYVSTSFKTNLEQKISEQNFIRNFGELSLPQVTSSLTTNKTKIETTINRLGISGTGNNLFIIHTFADRHQIYVSKKCRINIKRSPTKFQQFDGFIYAALNANTAGGGFNPRIINIDQDDNLYDDLYD